MLIKKPCIYIAGPLFTMQDRAQLEKIRNYVLQLNFDTFLPHENNNDNADGRFFNESQATLKNIFKNDYQAIEKSDAVIALLDGVPVDCGTAWELGFAFALAKPILGIRTDFRILGNFANQHIDLMSESCCTKLLFVPDGKFTTIENGIKEFLDVI